MNTLRFGVEFIDQHIKDLLEKNIYTITDKHAFVKNIFIHQLIDYNLKVNHSVLYLSSQTKNEDNCFIENFLSFEHIVNPKEFDNLLILEIPQYAHSLISDSFDLNHILNDLKIYVDYHSPDIIIIEHLELLITNSKNEVNTSYLSQFMNFFNRINSTIFIDISFLKFKDRNICEKFSSASFEIIESEVTNNYQLIIKKFKNVKQQIPVTFSLDVDHKIIPALCKNKPVIKLENCKQIVLKHGFNFFEDMFKDIFPSDLSFLYYQDISSFKKFNINDVQTLIIISAMASDDNRWQFISWVRRNYPLSSIIFISSINIPANQKVRAIRLGADKVINFPIDKSELISAVECIYTDKSTQNDYDTLHNIHISKEEFLKKQVKSINSKPFVRELKNYVFTILSNGFSLHFYKLKTPQNTPEILFENLSDSDEIIFISTYTIEENNYTLFIFKNLSMSQIRSFKQQISNNYNRILKNNPEEIDSKVNAYSNFLKMKNQNIFYANSTDSTIDVKTMNYPLEETNFDIVINWIYEP